MRAETRVIKGEADLPVLMAWLRFHLPDAPLEVTVSTPKQTRSTRQHRLYWLWVTQIASHMGLQKDDLHTMFKRTYAVPIFTRDDEDYAVMVTTVKAIRKGGQVKEAERLAKVIARLTSTTDFSVSQMSEYLNDVEMYGAEIGAAMTFPEDLMGAR